MNPDCVFCLIINGTLPSEKVFEDDSVFAFLDIHPVNLGHTLVIPKAHHEDIFTTPPALFLSMMRVAQLLAPHIKAATGAEGINIGMNNGGAAGQLVFHAHIHVIPRFTSDGHKHWAATSYKDGEAVALGTKIREQTGG